MRDFTLPPRKLVEILPESCRDDIPDTLLITEVQSDSRQCAPGALFVALPGKINSGEQFIGDAVQQGAVAVLVEKAHLNQVLQTEVPHIGVEDLKSHLPEICQKHFGDCARSLDLIGVTGTNGKSSITSYIAQIYANRFARAAVIGTLGYGMVGDALEFTGLTTPDLVQTYRILAELVQQRCVKAAMEVSSHGIDQGRVAGLRFEVGVLSNITRDHLDYHGSFKAYADTKKSFLLSRECHRAVINADDTEAMSIAEELKAQGKPVITYGIANGDAAIRAIILSHSGNGMHVEIESPWGNSAVFFPLLGDFNLSNALAALGAVCALGEDFSLAVAALARLNPVPGRMEKVELEQTRGLPEVLIDYAHTPDALENVLRSARPHARRALWVVFGCGGDRDSGKRAEMGKIAAENADRVVITSDNPRSEPAQKIIEEILKGVPTDIEAQVEADRRAAIAHAVNNSQEGDLIVIAGKGHEDYQLIQGEKLKFSDLQEAERALRERAALGGND